MSVRLQEMILRVARAARPAVGPVASELPSLTVGPWLVDVRMLPRVGRHRRHSQVLAVAGEILQRRGALAVVIGGVVLERLSDRVEIRLRERERANREAAWPDALREEQGSADQADQSQEDDVCPFH